MLKNLRIRHRILLGYAVPLLLSIIVAMAVYANISTAHRQFDMTMESADISTNVSDLELNVARAQRAVRGYVIIKNDISRKTFEDAVKGYREFLQTLDKLIVDPKQRMELQKISGLGGRLMADSENLISLVDRGKQAVAIEEFRKGDIINLGRELEGAIDGLEKALYAGLKEMDTKEERAIARIGMVLVIGTSLTVVLAVLLGIVVSSRIGRTIGESTNAIASSSTEIAATINQHERTASQQAAMVNETTSTVEELGSSSRQAAEQATAAAEVAKRASAMTEEGAAAVRQAVLAMTGLKEKVGAVADQILRLGEQTAQIGSIADIVKDLAGQTNMLALNAAVEAVRAGEHGKGFSVLAAEVRKLSSESKKSAVQANAIIAEIQKATNSTIMVTEEGTRNIEEVVVLAQKVGELFTGLSSAASNVHGNAQQVLLNARQQSSALGQVVNAVNTVNTGIKETVAGIAQTRTGVEKLNETAKTLNGMI
ncbi:MAG: CHASE3 domain-containing protein [Deltaproteobacteria bacterium]|nr:CHASE3 domain-containing protein [Deltaproteobacteria bacterium]